MEILLLKDVPGIGKKNDLLVVGDGFALNHLLPSRQALVATPLVRKRYAEFIKRRAEEREREKQSQAGIAKALSGKEVLFTRKVTKTGKLYGAISAEAIAEALKEQHQMEVSPDAINIADPIKSTGTFTVDLGLAGQVTALKVVVKAEK